MCRGKDVVVQQTYGDAESTCSEPLQGTALYVVVVRNVIEGDI